MRCHTYVPLFSLPSYPLRNHHGSLLCTPHFHQRAHHPVNQFDSHLVNLSIALLFNRRVNLHSYHHVIRPENLPICRASHPKESQHSNRFITPLRIPLLSRFKIPLVFCHRDCRHHHHPIHHQCRLRKLL